MSTTGFIKQNGDKVVTVNGQILGYYNPKTRPQRSKRYLEIGQKYINFLKGVGDAPTEDEIQFLKNELYIEDVTARSRRV